jgi:hypothetical protein
MPEKERARLKEQYIKELRRRKEVLQTVKAARNKQAADQALLNMVEALESTGGTVDEFTERLDAETALTEARLEIALENQPESALGNQPESALGNQPPESEEPSIVPETSKQPSAPVTKTIGSALGGTRSDEDA